MSSVCTYSSLLLIIFVNIALCVERPAFKLLGEEIRNKLLKLSEEITNKDVEKNIKAYNQFNDASDVKTEENNFNKQFDDFNILNSTEENELFNGSSIETRAVRNGFNPSGYNPYVNPANSYGQYYPGFVANNPYAGAVNNFIPVGFIANPNIGYNNMNQNSRFVNGLPYNNIPTTNPIFGGTISNHNLGAFYNNPGFSGNAPNPSYGNGGNPSLGYRDSGFNGGFNNGFNNAHNINPSFGANNMGYAGGNPNNFNSGPNNGYPNGGYNGGNPNMGFNGGNQNFGMNNPNPGYNPNINNPNPSFGMTNPNTGFSGSNSNNGVGNSKPNSGTSNTFNSNINSKPNNGNNNFVANNGLVQPYGTNGPTNNNGNSGIRYTNVANSPPPSAGAPVTAKPIFTGVKVV